MDMLIQQVKRQEQRLEECWRHRNDIYHLPKLTSQRARSHHYLGSISTLQGYSSTIRTAGKVNPCAGRGFESSLRIAEQVRPTTESMLSLLPFETACQLAVQ